MIQFSPIYAIHDVAVDGPDFSLVPDGQIETNVSSIVA